ncbi:hypothetical protein DFQ28_000699 [Apophysomyces sp. BC1034]|nr:hypothetical protein DFQ28_000699 [Apophysomyces sp. BC1034]
MTWIKSAIDEYFRTALKERVSYAHFLKHMKPDIIGHSTSETNFNELDSVLYNNYKAKLDNEVPKTALRRFTTKRFWTKIRLECFDDEYKSDKDQLAQQYKKDSLALMGQARQQTTGDLSNTLLGSKDDRKHKNRATESTHHHNNSQNNKDERISSSNNEVNDESNNDDPFRDRTPFEHARSSIFKYRLEADHISDIHKQDLLYYGIIDLTRSTASKFRDHISEECVDALISLVNKQHKEREDRPDDVKEFVASVTSSVNNLSGYRTAIKEAKQELRQTKDYESKWKKGIIRLMKHFRDTFNKDGSSLLYRRQGEMNYTSKFLTPIIGELFKHVEDIEWQWGDMAHDVLKEEEQAIMKDDEPRLKGSMPDGFFKLRDYGLIMALMEVSGPPNTKDHAHFVGDKVKLAKLLKRLLKKVRQTLKREGDHSLYQEIKLYGLQFYNHKLYVYSLGEPAHGLYVFREELHFDLACEIGFLANFVPRCLRNLIKVQVLLSQSAESIKAYINSDSMGNSSDSSSDSRDSIYISPRKKSKTTKNPRKQS